MNEGRKEILQVVIVLTGIVFLGKLFFIQLLDDRYAQLADSNSIMKNIEYPFRGLIYDRNGNLLVYNSPEYDLLIVKREVSSLDSARFCEVFDMTQHELNVKFKELRARKEYSPYKPTVFIKQLSNYDFAKIQEHLDEFKGFYIQPRTSRAYATRSLANAVGYVSEISKPQLDRDSSKLYRQGDYIGQSGIESYYETFLRGQRGIQYKLRNVKGIEKGSFKDGAYDTLSIPGKNLITSIDLKLQEYGEYLLYGKVGSIVALEPSTGEVLAMVSGPSYDPSMLTGKKFSANFVLVSSDTTKPLFNRPLMAMYPPGSIFKIVQSLIGLQEGVLTYDTRFPCDRSLVNCHNHPNPTNLHGAIQYSCNPYFHQSFRRIINQNKSPNTFIDSRIGLDNWRAYVKRFGLGEPLGVDLPSEKGGQMPTSNLYNRIYGEGRWKFSTIYSLSIGQGEMLVTPLQMANIAAIMANKGYFYTPHLVKAIDGAEMDPRYTLRHETGIDSAYFSFVQDAMSDAIYGTAQRAIIPGIALCGKTGTAQNPHGYDHSVFMAFAPKEDPKIAIAVYVENAGWGGRSAASIASLMIEKYLTGEVKRKPLEAYVLKGDFLDPVVRATPTAQPVKVNMDME
ncbi:MAG: peptidoglycan glycosyltransferase [Cyclobacteriaceae bacterium]|nr:peptidoglycan glycosyltransferase [Cyclobacteriaceae bacterium]UYN87196.1 MAG: peptidoglycan glycosyltransferase [Cyclobacteriaceae bacterium]